MARDVSSRIVNDSSATVGSVIELEGVLRAVEKDGAGPLLRFEHLSVFEEGRLEHRKTQWVRRDCVIELDDGSRVTLDASELLWKGLLPSRRIVANWSQAQAECVILPEDLYAQGGVAVELRVASVDEGARVMLRGTVLDVRADAGKSQGFRENAQAKATRVRVTHLASGSDPARTLALALEGHAEDARSALRSKQWHPWAIVGAAVATAMIAALVRERIVWSAQLMAMAASLLATSGAAFADAGRVLSVQWSSGADGGERDVRVGVGLSLVFAAVMVIGIAIDLGFSLGASASSSGRSLIVTSFGWAISVSICASAYAIFESRALREHGGKLLHEERATALVGGVIEGRIVDPTPVESALGPAAIVAITEEEVVPGSDPNITTHRELVDDGFSLRTQDGDVLIDPRAIRWATTVHAEERSGQRRDRAFMVHSAIVPVGAPALAWGTVRPSTKGKILFEHGGSPAVLLVCAQSEDPRSTLRSIVTKARAGVALACGATLALLILLALVWLRG